MKTIGHFEFPETREEATAWTPDVVVAALDRRVLAVAKTRIEGAWSVYCGSVRGECHSREYFEVLEEGSKLSETIARAIFPRFVDVPYAP